MATDPYRKFVRLTEQLWRVPLPAPGKAPRRAPAAPGAPVALLFSPHPDDEVLTGLLPLRLQREAGARVVNVAVTLGSNRARRAARERELAAACAHLGWETEILGGTGLDEKSPARDPAVWRQRVHAAAEILRRYRPAWVFYPHAQDEHPTHRGTHRLAKAALAEVSASRAAPPWRVLTEYWHPLTRPNLLVECPPALLAELLAALCCHRGEIARNPYHRTLAAWMMDNVRRGTERVAGPGAPAPEFPFGLLYRVEPSLPAGWTPVLRAGALLGG